jgi:hypothetical protein
VILNETNLTITTQPNETINFNFIVSPVVFTNYTIKSWGLFDINDITINNLNDVYYYSDNETTPAIPEGVYYQAFEISNGLQTQYVIFTINNSKTLTPIIMKFDYPTEITYGKYYNVSLLASNVNNAVVEVSGMNFALANTSDYYWEGRFFVVNSTNNIKLKIENPYTNLEKIYNITVKDLDFPANNIILPAVAVGQSSSVLLVDFNVDFPIPVNVSATPILGENQTQDFEFYIVDETGKANPTQAKQLYVVLNPKKPTKNTLEVNITSPDFLQKTIRVEFLGSQNTYPPEMNITYYNKPAFCKLVGNNLLNSSYECKFYLPYNINPENLQASEINMLKESYEMKINTLNDEINNLSTQRLILIVILIIACICLIIYVLKDKIILLGGV